MLDYQKIVRAAESLDPVPISVSRLVAIVAQDHWAFSDVEQVISLDQALTGRLLRIANSAWSASLMPIGTVKDAVIRIGIGPTVSFAVGACVGPTFRRALPEYGLSEGQLWRHSVTASLAAEVLAAMSRAEVPAESVSASLLHDVGKLVLARFLTPDLLTALSEARASGECSSMQAEIDVLGVHHGEAEIRACRGDDYPSLASAVARLGEQRLRHAEVDCLGSLAPVYLRLSEAEKKRKESANYLKTNVEPTLTKIPS